MLHQRFDSASTDTGTGQEGDKEDADETKEKNEHAPEDRYTYKCTCSFFVALHLLILYLLDGCKVNSQGLNLRGCDLEKDVALSSGLVVL